MIKTIIADDEAWVCQLITGLIDWEAHGFKVIGNAFDGLSLNQMIKELDPDLVISDIKMPGMDGLSVIKKAKEAALPTKFIIISGYNDFEYAKAAIHTGVLGYLLKPVEPAELIELLSSIKENAFSGSSIEKNDSLLKKQLEKSQTQYLEYYLYHYLFEPDPTEEILSFTEINRQFGTAFADGCFRISRLMLDPRHDSWSSINDTTLNHISALGYSMYRGTIHETSIIHAFRSVVLLANYSFEKRNLFFNLEKEFFYSVCRDVPNISRFHVTLGRGSEVGKIEDIPSSFLTAQRAVHARVKLGRNKIIELSDSKKGTVSEFDLISPKTQVRLTDYITHISQLNVEEFADELFDSINTSASPDTDTRIASHVMDLTINTLSAKTRITFLKETPLKRLRDEIDACGSVDELKQFIIRLLKNISQSINAEQNKVQGVIDMIKAYIDEHYSEDIKLNDIAKLIYMNPNYVSDLFKNTAGTNFSKYLILKRIEMAKVYLMDVRYHINDIAAMVGYTDAKYFAKLFKTHVGVSPMQYRKMFC